MATRKPAAKAAKPAAKRKPAEPKLVTLQLSSRPWDTEFDPATQKKLEAARKKAADEEAKIKAEGSPKAQAAIDEINAAAQAALDRFKAEPKAKVAFHLHHTKLAEVIGGDGGATGVKGAAERINYVLGSKYASELLPRLRVMRPIPPDKVPAKTRIYRKDVDAALDVRDEAAKALKLLTRRGQTELSALRKAYDEFTDEDWSKNGVGRYPGATEERREALVKAAQTFRDAVASSVEAQALKDAQAAYDAAVEAARQLENDYYRQQYGGSKYVPDSEALWALHAELCEKDCPFTKEHQSVIPPTKR